jgi:sulfur dioxygenase
MIRFGGRFLEARSTPGQTQGSMCFVSDDRTMAFTGSTLLIRGKQAGPRGLIV